MRTYKHKINGKEVIIISENAAGMCSKTIGLTMIVYKYKGDSFKYPFIMESNEFHLKHF